MNDQDNTDTTHDTTHNTADDTKASRRYGPKPLGLVRCNAMITKAQKRKIERVRKLNRLNSEAQALRFIIEEFG